MKAFLTCFLLIISFQTTQAVEITLLYRNGTSEIREYEEMTEKLEFNYAIGQNIVEISGLDQLDKHRIK